jgi:DNA-binding NarL/FixJ family response regulator
MGSASAPVRVLICDDDERFCEALRLLFERVETIEVIASASNGEEAVKLAMLLRPDLVTMDIDMPVMDGVEATRRLGYLLPNVKVILVSGSEYADRAETARQAGAAALVTKTRVFEELVEVVLAVARGENFVSVLE